MTLPLLDDVLAADAQHGGLSDREREAFASMREDARPLTPAQFQWVEAAARRLGLDAAANVFSAWSAERRAAERARAPRFAWETQRPLKPPGRV